MELETEIAVKFNDTYHKAVVNILYTHNWLTNIIRSRLRGFHLTLQQYNVLRILRRQHPLPATVNILKERMLDKMSDASRIVERLVQKGLVVRYPNQKDRRAVDIFLTDRGVSLIERVDEQMFGSAIISNKISEEEAEELNRILDKIRS